MGRKHTHTTTVGCECLPVIWTLPFILVFSGVFHVEVRGLMIVVFCERTGIVTPHARVRSNPKKYKI